MDPQHCLAMEIMFSSTLVMLTWYLKTFKYYANYKISITLNDTVIHDTNPRMAESCLQNNLEPLREGLCE